MLDMNISQFLKSLGLEHLRDIFEREQVSYLKKTKYNQSFLKCNHFHSTVIQLFFSCWCKLLNRIFPDHSGCVG